MNAQTLNQMKSQMVEAEWCEIEMLADAVSGCETGPDFADALINRIGISTGDIDDDMQAWALLAQWYDCGFSTVAPF